MAAGQAHTGLVKLTTKGLVAGGSVVWRHRGKLRATIIAKATFSFSPGAIRWEQPVPLRARERFYEGAPQIVRLPAERAVALARAELLFAGHAHSEHARITLSRQDEALVDKGVGSAHTQPGAGLGPIAATAAARSQHLGGLSASALDSTMVELPDAFDRAFFQAASADQQLDRFHGHEMLMLEDLHPSHRRVRMLLPAANVAAIAELSGRVVPLQLKCDTLIVDAETSRCTLLWRGRFTASQMASITSTTVQLELQASDNGMIEMTLPVSQEPQDDLKATMPLAAPAPPLNITIAVSGSPDPKAARATPFDSMNAATPPPVAGTLDIEQWLEGNTTELTAEDIRALKNRGATPFEGDAPAAAMATPAAPPPIQPAPIEPAPIQPAPVEPPPIEPASVEPAPAEPVAEPPKPEPPKPEPAPEPEPAPIAATPAADPWAKPAPPKPKPKPKAAPPKRPSVKSSLYKKFS